jgi:hypothetical protein
MTDVSRFSAERYPGHTVVTRREKPPTGSPIRRPYAKVYQHEFAALSAAGRISGPAVVLLLELIRQSGLETIKKRDGWVLFSDNNLEIVGLTDKYVRHRAACRLASIGWIEIKAISQHKLQYRLNPDWAKPKAEVINLAAAKQARGRK